MLRFLLDELHRKLTYCVQVAWKDEQKVSFPLTLSDSKYSPMDHQRIPTSPPHLFELLSHTIVPAIVLRLEANRRAITCFLATLNGTSSTTSPSPDSSSLSAGIFLPSFQCLSLPFRLKDKVDEASMKHYIASLCKILRHSSTQDEVYMIESSRTDELVERCFHFYRQYEPVIKDFPTIVELVGLLDVMLTRFPNPTLSSALSDLAMTCLRRRWGLPSSSAPVKLAPVHLTRLFEISLRHASDTRENIGLFCTKVFPEWIDREIDKQDHSAHDPATFLATLNTNTIIGYFKVLIQAIGTECKGLLTLVKTNRDDLPAVLNEIFEVVVLFKLCLQVTRSLPKKPFLASTLREGRRFLDFFYALIPFLSRSFEHSAEAVARIFHELEDPVITLQAVCKQTKDLQDVGSGKYIPLLTKSLDQVVYSTRAVFESHNHSDALRFGTHSVKPLAKLQKVGKKQKSQHPSQSDPEGEPTDSAEIYYPQHSEDEDEDGDGDDLGYNDEASEGDRDQDEEDE